MRLLKSLFSVTPTSLTIGVTLLVVLLFRSSLPILDLIELKTYDRRFLLRDPVQPASTVVLALVDEKSLDREGRWPWPRAKFAALIETLSRDGAKVIGFDIGFLEPDENSQLTLLNQLSEKLSSLNGQRSQFADFIRERRKLADNDATLETAIKQSSATIVLGYFFHDAEENIGYKIDPQKIDQHFERISTSKYPVVISKGGGGNVKLLRGVAPESNLAVLTEAAAASGYFTLKTDPDGIIRWMPLVMQGREDLFPPLSLLCTWHYLGKPPLTATVGQEGVEEIRLGEVSIPTDNKGRLLINYLGDANNPKETNVFPFFSISDILSGQVPAGAFANKIVLVGATATGIYDLRSTPLRSVYPGLEIHATTIDNLLTQRFMRQPLWAKVYDQFIILVLGAVVGFVLPRIGALKGFLFAATLGVLHVVIADVFFVSHGVWINIVHPLLALAANATALTVYSYITEEREREKIKGAFEHYVAPEVVDELVKHPEKLNLGGERRVLSVLFTDLKGFTAISERTGSQQLVELLNEYFSAMTDIVLQHQGTLDKFIGDSVMAFYGAPIERDNHPLMACYTAIDMSKKLQALREEWKTRDLPPLSMRIGIHTGEMIVGNIGSKDRFNYTVMGDAVNLASRLEGMNKAYGTITLVGEDTAQLVKDACLLREVDMVQVVGKAQAVRIYELLDRVEKGLPSAEQEAFRAYAAGLASYRAQRWQEAAELFRQALALAPDDGPSYTMLARCRIYELNPPPPNWSGVFEATNK
jgi:adenylate cyclase